MPIQIGDILGDYEVTGILGRGGMGKVFRVRSLLTEREEAMKVVLADLDEKPDLADRFLREMKVHASLQHPNIAALHAAQRIEGRLVMLLELVEGASLEQMLRDGRLEVPRAVDYIVQVLSALEFAHARGVIHRDIKPANILVRPDGVVKLTDFGIARSNSVARLTGTGLAVGTLAYMSPEQILARAVDARSDLYSLGLTFYEMVTGRRAIQAGSEHDLMNAQLRSIPEPPAAVNPLIPEMVSVAIMRALQKEPERRFQTALEFQAALQRSTPVPVPSAGNVMGGPDLAELQTELARAIGPIARRLFPEAARRYGTLAEIREALAAQIGDPQQREAFRKTCSSTNATRTYTPAAQVVFDAATLDRLAEALAPYLGPIAKVIVNRAARTAGSVEELRDQIAARIPSEEDRKRYLDSVRSAL